MKYTKPELTLTKSAIATIQGSGKSGIALDNASQRTRLTVPAYEADE